VPAIGVGRVSHKCDATNIRILADHRSRHLEKRAAHRRGGVQRREPAGAGVAESTNEDCFDLIVTRVGGDDGSMMTCGDLVQKFPARLSPCGFGLWDAGPPPDGDGNAQPFSRRHDELGRLCRRRARPMIEGGDEEPVERQHSRRGVEQRHGVGAPRDREDVLASRLRQGCTDGGVQRRDDAARIDARASSAGDSFIGGAHVVKLGDCQPSDTLRDATAPFFSLFFSLAANMILAPTGLETHGPLGTLWVSLGLICFYIALIWINTLLGVFLTPLFLIPQTWLFDFLKRRKEGARE